jgi:hypothetical protein
MAGGEHMQKVGFAGAVRAVHQQAKGGPGGGVFEPGQGFGVAGARQEIRRRVEVVLRKRQRELAGVGHDGRIVRRCRAQGQKEGWGAGTAHPALSFCRA